MRRLVTASLSVFFCSATSWAQGGPPMITDDPGTPGNNHWEINIASLFSFRSLETSTQVPYFDVNYGVGERLQLKIESGWSFLSSNSSKLQSGMGLLLVGVKCRFYDEGSGGLALSTYPQFQFRPFFSSPNAALNPPGEEMILPFEASKTLGDWEVNPDVAYVHSTESVDEIFYGTVLAFEALKPWELLAEIHATTALDASGTQTLINFGFRYTVTSTLNLMASLGRTVSHFQTEWNETDAYLGLQLEH